MKSFFLTIGLILFSFTLFSCSGMYVQEACEKIVVSAHRKVIESKVKQCIEDYDKGDKRTKKLVDKTIEKIKEERLKRREERLEKYVEALEEFAEELEEE